jgi:hypothetical protein
MRRTKPAVDGSCESLRRIRPLNTAIEMISSRQISAGQSAQGSHEVTHDRREEAHVAGKIDAVLKLTIVASVLLASSSVGYYYSVYLPHRDEPQRVVERFRAAGEKRAEQEQLLFEQRASEQRAAEQRAAEGRQASEKANRYQACLTRATGSYNASRLAACNRPREKIIKDRDDCIKFRPPDIAGFHDGNR